MSRRAVWRSRLVFTGTCRPPCCICDDVVLAKKSMAGPAPFLISLSAYGRPREVQGPSVVRRFMVSCGRRERTHALCPRLGGTAGQSGCLGPPSPESRSECHDGGMRRGLLLHLPLLSRRKRRPSLCAKRRGVLRMRALLSSQGFCIRFFPGPPNPPGIQRGFLLHSPAGGLSAPGESDVKLRRPLRSNTPSPVNLTFSMPV